MTAARMLVLFLGLASGAALAQDTPETRREAAERYLRAVPMSKLMEDSVTELARQQPEAQRAQFAESMRAALDVRALERAALDAMVKTFTTAELNALADFYGSPVGQSAMRKFGRYMALVMPAIQREVMRAMQESRPPK